MTTSHRIFHAAGVALPLLALAAMSPASAQVIAGGTSSTTAFPFGTNGSTGSFINYNGEYQQIYGASTFAAPVAISAISFASASSPAGLPGLSVPETANYNIIVGLSNTAATVAAPSATFSNNLGPNFTTVFSGTVTANLQANNTFDLTIPFTTPFVFVPGLAGDPNLLLDVFINGATSSSQTDLFVNGNSGNSSRVFYSSSTNTRPTVDQNGLETRFAVTPAPEPSPLLTLALGAGVAAAFIGRRATRRTAA